jgi:hypothetical protein
MKIRQTQAQPRLNRGECATRDEAASQQDEMGEIVSSPEGRTNS